MFLSYPLVCVKGLPGAQYVEGMIGVRKQIRGWIIWAASSQTGTVRFMSLDWVSLSPFSPPCIFRAFIVLFMNYYSFSIFFFTQTWSPFHFMVHTPCQNYLLKIPNSLLLSKRKSWTFQPNFQGSLSSFPLVLPSHDFQFNFTISLLSPGWRGIFPFVCFVSFFPLQPDLVVVLLF